MLKNEFDITTEIRDFTYITNIYKFIESYNLIGHQIGRKVGDMLELLTLGVISKDPELVERMVIEDGLEGYTTAKHKVEFGLYNDLENKNSLFGSIECKCVGVEVTKDGKNNIKKLIPGQTLTTHFKPNWLQKENREFVNLSVSNISNNTAEIKFESKYSTINVENVKINDRFLYILDENGKILIIEPTHNLYESVPNLIRNARVLRVIGIEENSITLTIFKCLTGPQTIEKAKQASLVAMDLRKKIDGVWGKEEIPEEKKSIISVLVLCEFSHWEAKSRNVIKCCIDHNLIIPDAILIDAFKEFEYHFGAQNMLNYINKKNFRDNEEVQNLIYKVLEKFDDKILYDIELNEYVKFHFNEGRLNIVSI